MIADRTDGAVSFLAASRISVDIPHFSPTACAVGCILAPLCGCPRKGANCGNEMGTNLKGKPWDSGLD